jgi:hypothetical protein
MQFSAKHWKFVYSDNTRKNLLALWSSVSRVFKDVRLVQTARTQSKSRTTDQVRRTRMHKTKHPRRHTPTSSDEFRSTGYTYFTFKRDRLIWLFIDETAYQETEAHNLPDGGNRTHKTSCDPFVFWNTGFLILLLKNKTFHWMNVCKSTFNTSYLSSSSLSSICHGVGPLVDTFRSHVFKGVPWFLLQIGE